MKLYHLSSEKTKVKRLSPRVPSNYFTKNGYEDNKTERVCFSNSINGALMALSRNLKNEILYVYIPLNIDKKIIRNNQFVSRRVPDAKITGEVWVLEPVNCICIGSIQVIKDKGNEGIKFRFGNNEAELYEWDWKWKEKY